MTKGSGKARLRRARSALSSLPQRSSGLFSKLICRVGKMPDYWANKTQNREFFQRKINPVILRTTALSGKARFCGVPDRLISETHLSRGESAAAKTPTAVVGL